MEDLFGQHYLSSKDAAQVLGYTVQHTRLLIRQGQLPARKFGRDWLVGLGDLARFRVSQAGAAPARLAAPEVALPSAPNGEISAVNVAQVPKLSPFRYPGGKTWLIPYVRAWLRSLPVTPRLFVEPFAGGAIAALTAVFEDLADRAMIVELDEDVSVVWRVILRGDSERLIARIKEFVPSRLSVRQAIAEQGASQVDHAFATIVRNRMARGGILAPGAGIVKHGENGKGLASRWYPETLGQRIAEIARRRQRLDPVSGDGLGVMRALASSDGVVFFVDPPYTVAGRRLYKHSEMDHEELFRTLARVKGSFLATYDDAPEIRALTEEHRLQMRAIAMKTTHHLQKQELLISRDLAWLPCNGTA
jgi:DNA adenine methylase